MTDSESTHKQAQFDECRETFRIDDADVLTRGQVTIEKKHRNAHEIDVGDYVDIEVYRDETTIRAPDVKVGESGRVTIPARQRERYSITEGDRVDVAVFLD